jgi:hypothetical protein
MTKIALQVCGGAIVCLARRVGIVKDASHYNAPTLRRFAYSHLYL